MLGWLNIQNLGFRKQYRAKSQSFKRITYVFLILSVFLPSPVLPAEPVAKDTKPQDSVEARMARDEVKRYDVPGLGEMYLETAQDVVQDVLRSGRIWEPASHEIFRKYVVPNTNVVDAGAFVGSHTIPLARLANPGKVYAFEPQKDMYELLKKNMSTNGLDNVVALPVALGDRNCPTRIMEMPEWKNKNKGANAVIGCVPPIIDGEEIEMRTLDSYKLENISFMKIDVEGSERILLQGARETIRKSMPVLLIEISSGYVNDRFTHHRGSSTEVTIPLLNELGYEVTHLWADDYLAIPRNGSLVK